MSKSDLEIILAAYPPAVRSVAVALRQLIFQTLPHPLELVDVPRKLVGYGFGARYSEHGLHAHSQQRRSEARPRIWRVTFRSKKAPCGCRKGSSAREFHNACRREATRSQTVIKGRSGSAKNAGVPWLASHANHARCGVVESVVWSRPALNDWIISAHI